MDPESIRVDLEHEAVDAERLRLLAVQFQFDDQAYKRASELAGLSPDADMWTGLIDRFLLVYGTALIVAGVAAFFAYNWDGLDKFAKFSLLEVAIVICVLMAWLKKLDSLAGKSGLFAAGFLVGVLLAVFGQTYQTGADPYSLFLGWALLISGWAVIGRQSGLWLLFAVLINLGLILYWEQVLNPAMEGVGEIGRIFGPFLWLFLMMSDYQLAQLVFVVNALVLIAWEYFSGQGVHWMQGRWFPRVIASFALLAAVAATLLLIFAQFLTDKDDQLFLGGIGFLLFIALSSGYYRKIRQDLYILASCMLSLIVVVTSAVARALEDDLDTGWLLLSLLVIGQTAAGAVWLRTVARSWRTA
ncbi:MAG: DUF2157 domain-containing protein [Gammaproteobacteria bacterium]